MTNNTPAGGRDHVVQALPIFLIAATFLGTRFLNLDADPPIFSETEYTFIDEFYYATKALFWAKQDLYDRFTEIANHFPFNWLSNVATFAGLKLLGLNFFGLRFSAVVAGLAVVVMTYVIARDRFGRLFGIFCALYLLIDYHFMLASRIVEPTIYRTVLVFASLLICRAYLRRAAASESGEAGGVYRILTSAVIVAFFLFEYPTNYFVIVAWVLMLIFAEQMTALAIARRLAQFGFAAIAVGAAYIMVLVWQGLYWDSPLRFISTYSGRVSGDLFNNYLNLMATQFLRHGPGLDDVFLIIFLAFGAMVLTRWLRARSGNAPGLHERQFDAMIGLMLAGAVGQILLDNSYPLRKPILLLPLLLLATCYCVQAATDALRERAPKHLAPVALGTLLAYSALFHLPAAWSALYSAPQYTLRNASIAMRKYDGYYFVGGYAWVYALYNDILPVGNPYLLSIQELGPSVREFYRMFIDGGSADPTLTVMETVEYAGAAPKGAFEPVEFLVCSMEPRYYPIYVFKQRGADLEDALSTSLLPRGSLDAPLNVGQKIEACPFHPEAPEP